MYVANKNGAQTWFPVGAMGDASDISDSPMIGQPNVFPDTTACSFLKEAVVEISTQLGNPQTLASTCTLQAILITTTALHVGQ